MAVIKVCVYRHRHLLEQEPECFKTMAFSLTVLDCVVKMLKLHLNPVFCVRIRVL